MNIKFNLGDIKVQLPAQAVNVEVGNISYEITDANPIEIAKATTEVVKAVLDLKNSLESSSREELKFMNEENERHHEKMAEIRKQEREHRRQTRSIPSLASIAFRNPDFDHAEPSEEEVGSSATETLSK